MSRRCACGRLMALVEGDPRLRTLPLAARMLFLLVAEAATRAAVPGLLPFAEPRRVSLLVSASETEVETQLETLIAEGLLRRQDGGLGVPALLDAPPRAEIARRNGAAGGRPRKGETREAARERRQAEMMLVVPGGAKPSETQAPEPVQPRTTTTEVQSVVVVSPEPPARDAAPEWVLLGQELAQLARLNPTMPWDARPVQGWLASGLTAAQVRAAVRRVVERSGYDPMRVRSLGYFRQAVEEQRGIVVPAASAPAAPMDAEAEAALVASLEARIARVVAGYAA